VLTLAVIGILISVIVSAVFIVIPSNDWVKTVVSVVVGGSLGYVMLRGWQRIFHWSPRRSIVFRLIAVIAAIGTPLLVFAIPGTPPALAAMPAHTFVTVDSSGNAVALFTFRAAHPATEAPIVFVNGGPGGAPGNGTLDFLKQYVSRGITAYAYDPLGTGVSPEARNGWADYTMQKEVERLHAVVEATGAPKVTLMAHSFGGNIAARYIAAYPATVARYIAIDTAPLYSMSGNTRQESNLNQKSNAESNSTGNSTLSVPGLDPREEFRMTVGLALTGALHRLPYGNPDEYNYYFTELVLPGLTPASGVDKAVVPTRKPSARLSLIPTLALNDDLTTTRDFTPELKVASANIPVLVFHPQFGIVPWQIHNAYRNFFPSVSYVAVPGAPHPIWETVRGQAALIDDGTAFILGTDLPAATWGSHADPFLK